MSTSRPSAVEASKAAKALTGQFANLKPDNPTQFSASVAVVLARYPLSLVEECVAPGTGLSSKVEFFSIKSTVEWLDDRLEYYQKLAQYIPRKPEPPELPDDPAMAERAGKFLAEVGALLKANSKPSPLDVLIEQRAQMRSEHLKYAIARARGEAAE